MNNFGFFQLEMIHDAGLLGTEHKVVTPDGYILTMHRISSPRYFRNFKFLLFEFFFGRPSEK